MTQARTQHSFGFLVSTTTSDVESGESTHATLTLRPHRWPWLEFSDEGNSRRLRFSLFFAALICITRLVSCGEDCYDEMVYRCVSSPEWLWASSKPYVIDTVVDVTEDFYDEGPGLTGEEIAAALTGGTLQRVGERTFVLEWQQGGSGWRVTVDATAVSFLHTYRYYTISDSYSERQCGDT